MVTVLNTRLRNKMQCVNCFLNLEEQPRRKVVNVNVTIKTLLNNWTSPYKVKESDVLCVSCYNILESYVSSGIMTSFRSFGHKDVCLCCGVSILNKRTRYVPPNCPELEIFKSWIPDYQMSVFTRSCISCWSRAKRKLQRNGLRDAVRAAEAQPASQDFDMVSVLETVPCVHCGKLYGEHSMCLVMNLSNDLLRCLAIMKAPQEFASEDYVCNECLKIIQKNIDSDIFRIKHEPSDATTESLNSELNSVTCEIMISSELTDSVIIKESNVKEDVQLIVSQDDEEDMLKTRLSPYIKSDESNDKVESFKLSNFIDSINAQEPNSDGINKVSDESENSFEEMVEFHHDSETEKDGDKSKDENKTVDKFVNDTDLAVKDLPNRCVRCNKSTLRRRHKNLYNDHPIAITMAEMIHPREYPRLGRICHACWSAAKRRQDKTLKPQKEKLREQGDSANGTTETVIATNSAEKEFIDIPNYSRVSDSARICILTGCTGPERKLVPSHIRLRLLTDYKVYVPARSRICHRHYHDFEWDNIKNNKLLKYFTGEHMEDMLNLLTKSAKCNRDFDFEDSEMMSPAFFQFLTGITQQQFGEILNSCPSFEGLKRSKTALGVYLLKLKTGESTQKLATISLKRKVLDRLLKDVRKILLEEFVPLHLGFDHVSRDNKVHRQLLHPEGLFGNLESLTLIEKKYVYMLRKSVTPVNNVENTPTKHFLLLTSDGYILDVLEPLDTNLSDVEFNQILFSEGGLLSNLFVDDDIFVLDRQSKEMFGNIMVCNYAVQSVSPLSVPEEDTPSTFQDSRPKCLLRCLALSKHFALRFRQDFKQVTKMPTLKNKNDVPNDMRIAAALMNAFFPLSSVKMTEATKRKSL